MITYFKDGSCIGWMGGLYIGLKYKPYDGWMARTKGELIFHDIYEEVDPVEKNRWPV